MRRRSKKRSSDDRKASDRLSLFGGSLSGTLAKARKPVPRISSYVLSSHFCGTLANVLAFRSNDKEKNSEHDWGLGALARMRHGDRKASGRPSTSSGDISVREKVQEKPKEFEKPTSPVKDKEKRDSAVLRKRTSSTSDIASRSPAFASQIAGGVALKPGKSILEQIGTPDHNGWMRKKTERYNSWKLRYFILKGPHLYFLKSNDKSVRVPLQTSESLIGIVGPCRRPRSRVISILLATGWWQMRKLTLAAMALRLHMTQTNHTSLVMMNT